MVELKYGLLDKIELRLANGLLGLAPNEVDAVTILGMGGETITKILGECEFELDGIRLILQPMTKAEILRKWLADYGYKIASERVVFPESTWAKIPITCRFAESVSFPI